MRGLARSSGELPIARTITSPAGAIWGKYAAGSSACFDRDLPIENVELAVAPLQLGHERCAGSLRNGLRGVFEFRRALDAGVLDDRGVGRGATAAANQNEEGRGGEERGAPDRGRSPDAERRGTNSDAIHRGFQFR